MVVVVTGAAGFIGYHVAGGSRSAASSVIGVDNLNDFYDVELKRRRLAQLDGFPSFKFRRVDLADRNALAEALKGEPVRRVIHLAAQANVRYALENPHAYVDSNVAGHLNMLEYCRHAGGVENARLRLVELGLRRRQPGAVSRGRRDRPARPRSMRRPRSRRR